jgi:four helix bundle protein
VIRTRSRGGVEETTVTLLQAVTSDGYASRLVDQDMDVGASSKYTSRPHEPFLCALRHHYVMAGSYRDLIAWQKAIALAHFVYELTASFPKREMFGLTSQLRRAAVSVPSNIAEGNGRITRGEWQQFLGHARGSLLEVETELIIAHRAQLISDIELELVLARSSEVGRLINGLLRASSERGVRKHFPVSDPLID